jgi:hypothetical protein
MGVTDEVKHVIAKELNRPVEQLGDDTKLGDLDADSFNTPDCPEPEVPRSVRRQPPGSAA